MKFNLVEFIDGAYQNSRRVLAEDPNVESLLQDITDAYSTALALPEVREERRAIFIAMSHASFLGAVQLATSGQLPPSFLRNDPREQTPAFDRRVAPALALCIIGLVTLGLAGSWLAYLWSGETQFEFGP